MGGIIIILSFLLGSVFFLQENTYGLLVVFATLGFGIIGFIDDYIKVVKKRSLGFRALPKFLLQLVVTVVFLLLLQWLTEGSDSATNFAEFYLPFMGGRTIDTGIFFMPVAVFIMLGTANGANFTDGLDGLASGVTVLIAVFFLFTAYATGVLGLLPISGAAAGSLLGFLLFNTYPARVFMGDTGSLALGGFISAMAIILQLPLFLVIVAAVYVIEVLSVIIQVLYFKATGGKRFFKMAPIHHHFEMMGWPESKVVAYFYIFTVAMVLIGFLATRGIF